MPRQKSDHVDSAAALADRLRRAREAKGLSQRQLAAGVCTPAYVSRLEKGERIPSLQLLRRLADRLDADADELASGSPRSRDLTAEADLALRLGDLDEAETLLTEALDEPREHRRALALLGQVAFERGDHREAIRLLEKAQLDGAAEADTLGRAYALAGELESAIAIFERKLDDARERNDDVDIVRFSVLLSNALIDGGNFGRAAELLGHSLAYIEETRDPIARARVWWSQSRLHALQNDPQTAARYARRALDTLAATEHTAYAARAHQLLAHIELDRDEPEEALALLERGYPLVEQSGNRFETAVFKLEQARALARLERGEEAASLAMEASTMLGDASPIDAGRAYALVAEVFATLGEHARALELYELADETLPVDDRYRAEVSTRRAELLEAAGRPDEALTLLKQAVRWQSSSLRHS